MLLSSGTLLIDKEAFAKRAYDRVKEWQKKGLLRKKDDISPLGIPLERFEVTRKSAAKKICNDILDRPNGNKGKILKDLRRVYRWLSLYWYWKTHGVFFIPLPENPGMYQPINSIKNDLAHMEEQFWVVQEPTHIVRNGISSAVYSIAEKKLDRGQIKAFQQTMVELADTRNKAWKKMKNIFKTDDVWAYLRRNI